MTQLVRTPLWDFQREDVERLADEPRVLIGNEMGTGKTLTAVERDLRLREVDFSHQLTLVVAPLNTHGSWAETFRRETGLKVKIINRKKREWFIGPKGEAADVYICHYEVLRLMPELRDFGWGHVIFDECHRLQNRKAKMTKSAKLIRTPYITAMSGSPVTTNPENIWSILNLLKPRTYTSYWAFYKRYVNYVTVPPQGYFKSIGPAQIWYDEGLPNLKKFFVRRLKKDVLKDLPPKVYGRIYVDLSPEQRKQYDDMKNKMIAWLETQDDTERPLPAPAVIAQLQRLQMFALGTAHIDEKNKVALRDPSTKVDAVIELLEDNPDEQFVIFTQFKGPLRILKRRFETHKKPDGRTPDPITYGSFTGDDHPRMRALHKREFIDGTRRVLLGTIASGGVGVDGLQHASSNVIFLDRAWSPAINEQAEDRLHRGGQRSVVNVIDVLARHTVDFQRLDRIEMKKAWIKKMLGDE